MSNSVKVLIATGTMNAGGAETLIMELLRRRSNRVQYIMLIHYSKKIEQGIYDEEIRKLGIPIVYIPSVGSLGTKRYIKEFEKIIEKTGHVDVIHSHLNGVGGVIAKAAEKTGIPNRIVHCHADITFTGSKLNIVKNEIKLAYMKTLVNRYANYYWACSESAAKRLFYNKKETKIIPNVIYVKDYLMTEDKRKTAKEKFKMTDRFVLGSIGRIARIKNYELVIKILTELKSRGKFAEFVCFGRVADEKYFQELQHQAEKLGVIEHIHFVGNSRNVPCDMGCIDVFLMPSISEGFGMAALEAQAAGMKTLVSEGVPRLIDIGAGLLEFLPLDDEKNWADAICKVENVRQIDANYLIECFNKKGFNSETMAKGIEDEYLQMKLRNC